MPTALVLSGFLGLFYCQKVVTFSIERNFRKVGIVNCDGIDYPY